jgi:hypothetical protein
MKAAGGMKSKRNRERRRTKNEMATQAACGIGESAKAEISKSKMKISANNGENLASANKIWRKRSENNEMKAYENNRK